MSLAALFFLTAVGATQPAPSQSQEAADRTPIRCRPAPFYVTDRGEKLRPERLIITGTRIPLPRARPTRPCHLMQHPGPPPSPYLRVADD